MLAMEMTKLAKKGKGKIEKLKEPFYFTHV